MTEGVLRRWPAHTVVGIVGPFCLVVGAAWTWDHVVRGAPVDATGWIIAGATILRLGTIVVALAAIRPGGARAPAPLLAIGLWGCAAAQLVYPLAETMAKAAVLAGWVEATGRGISNMSGVGWFNFAMAWLVFGVPGLMFAVLARDHGQRRSVSWVWPALGVGGGVLVLFGIGAVIG